MLEALEREELENLTGTIPKKRPTNQVPLGSSRLGDPITSQKAEKTRVGLEFDPNDDNAIEVEVNKSSLYLNSEAFASGMTEGHVPTPLSAVVKGTSGIKVTIVFQRHLNQFNSSSAIESVSCFMRFRQNKTHHMSGSA